MALSTCLVACSCISGGNLHEDSENSQPMATPAVAGSETPVPLEAGAAPTTGPRVMIEWQKSMEELLATKSPGEEYHALFSYGGWANAGQFAVFLTANGSSARLVLVEPSSKKINKERDLSDKELKRLLVHLNTAAGLADYIPKGTVFDALEYEYVHSRREASGKNAIIKRVYMQNPGGTGKEGSASHMSLIGAFEELRTQEN